MTFRPIRSIRRKIREINHHSRRVERDIFDRAQSIGFVVSAPLALLAVDRMDSWYIRNERTVLATARVFVSIDNDDLRAVMIDDATATSTIIPVGTIPLGTVDLVEPIDRRGWPLVSSSTQFPTESAVRSDARVTGSNRASKRAAIVAATEPLFRKADLVRIDESNTVHLASWTFSWCAWWCILALATSLAIAPCRFAWFLRRKLRNNQRQGRIDRCHCPNCGYNARESILRGVCPECGSELYERPEY